MAAQKGVVSDRDTKSWTGSIMWDRSTGFGARRIFFLFFFFAD